MQYACMASSMCPYDMNVGTHSIPGFIATTMELVMTAPAGERQRARRACVRGWYRTSNIYVLASAHSLRRGGGTSTRIVA